MEEKGGERRREGGGEENEREGRNSVNHSNRDGGRERKRREEEEERETQSYVCTHLEPFNLRFNEPAPCRNAVLLTQLVIHPRHPLLQAVSYPLELLSLQKISA